MVAAQDTGIAVDVDSIGGVGIWMGAVVAGGAVGTKVGCGGASVGSGGGGTGVRVGSGVAVGSLVGARQSVGDGATAMVGGDSRRAGAQAPSRATAMTAAMRIELSIFIGFPLHKR